MKPNSRVKQTALYKIPKECPVQGCDHVCVKRCDFQYHLKVHHKGFDYIGYKNS